MDFTHLHVHSHYSLLDGLAKIDDILDHCEKQNWKSIALTDHGVMYGIIEFYQKAKERGIKPILGVEAYVAPNGRKLKRPNIDITRYHLTLLAKNKIGYKNLIKLTTKAHLEGFYYKPRIDLELLKKYNKGLICLSGCVAGQIPRLLIAGKMHKAQKIARQYEKIFGKGNYYLEIMDHPNLPQTIPQLVELSKKTNIPLAATNDAHYVKNQDQEAHDILLCVQTNNTVNEKNRLNMSDGDYSLRSTAQMWSSFKDIAPEAVANTNEIAQKCNVEIKMHDYKLPHFKVPKNQTPNSYLEKLAKAGFKKRYKKFTPEIKKRFNYELNMIKEFNLSSYFLIVQDFVNWAKQKNIVVGPGRGSAAGCLISYLINITDVDPLKYGLLFERFLNPGRLKGGGLPDIDLDFADHRRDEVIDYVRKKYGQKNVAQIITFGTMAARAVIRDVGRALGYEYNYCDRAAKMVPMFKNLNQALDEVKEFAFFYQTDARARKLIDLAKKLEGIVRHASVHACGVVITKKQLTNYVPLQYAVQDQETITTQYEMHAVEDLGLLKMDFLGLKNLTIIEKTLEQIKQRRNKEIDFHQVPLNDKKTLELFQQGKTTAVFQFESSGMKRYLRQLQPSEFEDIIAMVALYRPGPMELIPSYIARKHGKEKVTYLHEKLKPILKNTYGIAVYQEQLLQIARDLAGFSLGEADLLRKAVGKKIKKLLEEQKEKFIKGCLENNISKEVAKKLFSFIEPFAQYGFNKSHGTCYATIAYRTAYLKAHFPVEFMAALLTADQGNTDRIAIDVNECKQMGIEVLPPDINESKQSFAVVNDHKIRFGLEAIKNVGHNIVAVIVENAPYKSLEDFLERVQTKDLNKKSMESLIKAGALDRFGERQRLLENLEKLLIYAKEMQKAKKFGQESLFGSLTDNQKPQLSLSDVEPSPQKQYLAWEKELLGFYLSAHPLTEYEPFLNQHTICCKDLDCSLKGSQVQIGGVVQAVKKITTKNNNLMAFVSLEDKTAQIEVIVFPKILQTSADLWQEGKLVLIKGRVDDRDGTIKFIAQQVCELE